jgi:signal transduction histidine kinase/ActR/RegA family two-component response regulator
MNLYDKTKEELISDVQELLEKIDSLNKGIAKRPTELVSAELDLAVEHREKEKRAAELIIANLELKFQSEEKAKRAAELVIAKSELVLQNKEKEKRAAELVIANKELVHQSELKEKRAAELIIANKELVHQSELRAKRAAELIIANKELAFQNKGKEKRATELVIANKELGHQSELKEKRAAELIIANKELAFQNNEKEKRAAELIIANKELAFQNNEKEKRAAELIIANKELAYQNKEKEKRAAELVIANKELIGQNELKEKRAAELIIANKELAFQNNEKEKRASELIIANKELVNQSELNKKQAAELILAKEHAEKADHLKSAFLANMSHEIRTPMNGILGFANLLKTPNLSEEEQQEYIEIIEHSGKRMLNIINDIMSISKIEAGLMEVFLEDSNINKQIEYIYTFFKPQTEAKSIALSFKNSLPEKDAVLKTDREKLYAILTNLVKNAIKYSEKGSIELGYTKNGTQLEFYVKDTGIGIDKDWQAAVFERFVQADISDEKAFQGAGLGLAISKAYVEMLGGKLWLKSEKGIGSTFYFTLPYDPETKAVKESEIDTTAKELETPLKKLKILIVDDDQTSRKLLGAILEQLSRETLYAKNGLEAVSVYRDNQDIDLTLMDMKMPIMDGYEATRQIRQINKKTLIIAQTAFALEGDEKKAIKVGCNHHITKPINKAGLLALIQKYFDK